MEFIYLIDLCSLKLIIGLPVTQWLPVLWSGHRRFSIGY